MGLLSYFFIVHCFYGFIIQSSNASRSMYSNSWAVELQPSATEAELVSCAQTLGLKHRKILTNGYYVLTDESNEDLMDKPNHKITQALKSNKKIKWVEQQVAEEYTARSLHLTDPDWTKQWYLQQNSVNGVIDHNVDEVWKRGYTGKHVTLAVIDDGVRKSHLEFRNRYDDSASIDLVKKAYPATSMQGTYLGRTLDVASLKDKTNVLARHGTKCAGVIAAGRNNSVCGVGAAYDCRIAGIRLFANNTTTDAAEAEAFFRADVNPDKVHIFSNSWGPADNGYSIRSPGTLAEKALKMGVEMGRNKLGSIYVFSSGNGGFPFGDSCAFDGYVNSIYTIAVASIAKDGSVPTHAERCGAIMTTVYSSNMVTASNVDDTSCSLDFGQTSAAAAFLSGIIALALEANPSLSWRDVQHLIARSSNREGVKNDVQWTKNAKEFHVNENLGFGVLDALTLVNKAEKWNVSVPPQVQCTLDLALDQRNKAIPVTLTFDEKRLTCKDGIIKSLEHVQLRVNLHYTRRAVIAVDVKSASGTTSRFVYPRGFDVVTARTTYSNLLITSVHYWGEPVLGKGNWSVIVEDRKSDLLKESGQTVPVGMAPFEGTVANVTLIFYGTTIDLHGNNESSDDNGDNDDTKPSTTTRIVRTSTVASTDNGTTKEPSRSKSKKIWIIVLVCVILVIVVAVVTGVLIYRWWRVRNSRRIQSPKQDVSRLPKESPEVEMSAMLPQDQKTYV